MANKDCSDDQVYGHLTSIHESKTKCFYDDKCMGVSSQIDYGSTYYRFCPFGTNLEYSYYYYVHNKTGSLLDFISYTIVP